MGALSVKADATSTQAFVDGEIHGNKVIVFSKTTCGYCKMAKRALTEVGAQFQVIELDRRSDGSAIQGYLSKITGSSTVPSVFINGRFIGGGTETQALQRSGQLSELVNSVS